MGNYRHKIKTKMETTVSWTEQKHSYIIQQDTIYQRHYKHQKPTDIYHIEAIPISLLLVNDNNSHISSRYTDIIQIGTTLWNKFRKQTLQTPFTTVNMQNKKQIWSVQQLWCNFNQGILCYTTKFNKRQTAGNYRTAGHKLMTNSNRSD